MSQRLSKQDADELRLWLTYTAAAYSEDGPDLPMAGRPLSLMLLVYLATEPDEVAAYGTLRSACRLKPGGSLSNAITSLEKGKLAWSSPSQEDGREWKLHLTDQGRIVVGQFLKARHLRPK